jgi:hypothetical protein
LAVLATFLAAAPGGHPASAAVEHHSSQVIVKIREDLGWVVPRGTQYLRRDGGTGIGLLAIVDGGTAARKARELRNQASALSAAKQYIEDIFVPVM